MYVSDDLKWGKEKLERKARNRKLDIHFVGANAVTDQRDRDRNRYQNMQNVFIEIELSELFKYDGYNAIFHQMLISILFKKS